LPEARLAWWERACDAALAAAWHPAVADGGVETRTNAGVAPSRRRLALLWAGVGACALALAATFVPWRALFATRGDAGPAPAAAVPLEGAGTPAARYDDAFALEHHPDLPRLLAGDEALLRDLDFGAWYAAQRDAVRGGTGDVAAAPSIAPDASAGATTAAAPVDPYAPQPLPAPDALSPAQRAQLDARVAADAALPPTARGALRERWDAWQRLPAAERSAVRASLHCLRTHGKRSATRSPGNRATCSAAGCSARRWARRGRGLNRCCNRCRRTSAIRCSRGCARWTPPRSTRSPCSRSARRRRRGKRCGSGCCRDRPRADGPAARA
jgi:hypothetical protein